MLKVFLYIVIFKVLLFSLDDLGTYEGTSSIEGKSFSDEINERIKNLDVKKIEEQMIIQKKASFNLGKNLPLCQETLSREYTPVMKFDEDLIIPYNNQIIFKKNETVNILKHLNINFQQYLLFLDADEIIQKKLANALRDKAMIMFANGDISSYVDKEQQIYVARKEFEIKSFNIKCLPSIVAQNNDKFIINEYKPDDLIKKDNK